jgi:hypothetical protein
VVPSGGGWITSFSYQEAPGVASDQLDFLVLRGAAGTYTVVGETAATAPESGGLEIFGAQVQGVPRNIPVQGGDILGFYVPVSLLACARGPVSGGGLISSTGAPSPPNVGDTVSLPGGDPNSDLNLSANLVTVPTSNECKHGGWKLFGFKSPGECLRFSRTH